MIEVSKKIRYVGVSDYDIELFEGQYKVPNGMAYNSYVILDEKVAVMDTVESNKVNEWLDEVAIALDKRNPDYLVIHHVEPDHSSGIKAFIKAYPNVAVVATKMAFDMLENFFGLEIDASKRIVATNGDVLRLGGGQLTFFSASMVHWPEVMVSYFDEESTLFSADAFGKFGAFDCEEEWTCEARRYYYGIVGKYGEQVQALLGKISSLNITCICPLHGPVLKDNVSYYLSLYDIWSSYRYETDGVMIAYTSVYGNTEKAVMELAEKIKRMGCPKVVVTNLADCDLHEAVEDAFRYSKLVLATTTYNNGIFPFMRHFIEALAERNFQNRTVGFIENGSWACNAVKEMKSLLSKSKELKFLDSVVSIKSSINDANHTQIELLAKQLCENYNALEPMDMTALFRIGYGLYAVSSRDGEKDNMLIVNTVTQVTAVPNRIAVTINKENYSHHIIKKTGYMNVQCLTESTPMSLFERFGFVSGRNVDKLEGIKTTRSSNGLAVLTDNINSYMSLRVESYVDLDTHGMFVCAVDDAKVLNNKKTMTYEYYHSNVKPKPTAKKGYVCKICGYVYDGEPLPPDFVCPLCKHGASDFEKIK